VTVKQLREQLARYTDDTIIAVAYWDKETVNGYAGYEQPMGEEMWREIVETYEDGEWAWQSMAADTFVDIHDDLKYDL
jgi:hypothetical protein